VTVTVASKNETVVKVHAGSEPSSASHDTLTFTPANWDTPKTVIVVAQDNDDTKPLAIEVVLWAEGGGYDGVTGEVLSVAAEAEAARADRSPLSLLQFCKHGIKR